MSFNGIGVEFVEGGVGIITLNRPQARNALSFSLRAELVEAVALMEREPGVRALVITGAGEAFCAGADVKELASVPGGILSPEATMNFVWDLANLRLPTIGAINGLAYGGGALLATAFDIRIGCERATFRFLAARYGRINSTWSLPVIVGWARTKELVYTGRLVEAEEALQIGLLNKVVPSDQLTAAAVEIGREIAKNVPESVQAAKRLLNQDLGRSWEDMYRSEGDAYSAIRAGEGGAPPLQVRGEC